MFIATPIAQQIARAQTDRLRVLIVGAGVAGLTLAQALRSEGLHPVLVERADDHAATGYMLGLMPMVDPVVRRLGLRQTYLARSARFHHYRLHGRDGRLLRDYEIDTLLSRHGDYRGIARGELMQVLADAGAAVSYATTLQALRQGSGAVHVTLHGDGVELGSGFDTVVLADGLHSSSRALLWPADQIATHETRFGGWVSWMDTTSEQADCCDEIWGTDFFIGIYPVKDGAGIFLGGHNDDTAVGPHAFVEHARRQLRVCDPRIEQALAAIGNDSTPYYWPLSDCRSATWIRGRVALLGDAAAGFLPTAGIGAGMAMESAGVLARELASVGAAGVVDALAAYERTQRPRVEAAQDNSRQLARLMFHRSRALAIARNGLMRLMPLKMALRPIRRLLQTMPAV